MSSDNTTDYTRIVESNADTLATRLAADVAEHLNSAIITRGVASLVVSGGSTPVPFFEALALHELPWEKVSITLADERQVPENHADSNAGLVAKHLLTGAAAQANFVSLFVDEADESVRVRQCEARLSSMATPFDVVILGMGGDAHTASLFPGMPNLADGLNLSTAARCMVTVPPEAPHTRLSLTLAALLDSRRIFFHLTGQSKIDVLEAALDHNDPMATPVAAVFQQNAVPVTVYVA